LKAEHNLTHQILPIPYGDSLVEMVHVVSSLFGIEKEEKKK